MHPPPSPEHTLEENEKTVLQDLTSHPTIISDSRGDLKKNTMSSIWPEGFAWKSLEIIHGETRKLDLVEISCTPPQSTYFSKNEKRHNSTHVRAHDFLTGSPSRKFRDLQL